MNGYFKILRLNFLREDFAGKNGDMGITGMQWTNGGSILFIGEKKMQREELGALKPTKSPVLIFPQNT